jgi:hypothetical protein
MAMRTHLLFFALITSACTPQDTGVKVQATTSASQSASSTIAMNSSTAAVAESTTAAGAADTVRGKVLSEAQLLSWRHLFPPDSIGDLSDVARASLNARHCQIPSQTSGANVIFGAFTAKGASESAVLCSVRDSTRLLVINQSGAVVDSMEKTADVSWMQGAEDGKWEYSQYLSVARMDDLNAVPPDTTENDVVYYGRTFPKPIDHDGIVISFLDKYATTYYKAKGKWYEVTSED